MSGGKAAALATAGLLAALSGAQAQDDVLKFATSFEVLNLNPLEEGYWMQEFGAAEMLMQFQSDGRFHPWLLERLERSDDRTWVLTLRPGITFQNGKPLTAEAVLASINHQLEHAGGARGSFPKDARFAVTGPLELTFTTNEPFPALPGLLANESVFVIYDAEAVIAAGDDVASLAGKGIYTGPYEVVAHTGARLTLERHEQYWQGEPAMGGVTVDFITDTNARLLAVQNGEVDIALFMPLALKPVVDATPGIHFNFDTPSANSYYAVLNAAEAPFADPQVRLAFSKAIDYAEIANEVFLGAFEAADSLYGPVFPWAVANLKSDPAEAERLLDEAGWLKGADGIRARDGNRLTVEGVYNPGVTDLVALAAAVQDQLRAVGIEVVTTQVPDTYAAYASMDWDFGMHNGATGGNGVPEDFLRRFVVTGGDRNYGGYSNAEVDALTAELIRTVDESRRNAILARVQQILVAEDPSALTLVFSRLGAVVGEAYAGYQPGFNFYNLDWKTAPGVAGEARAVRPE